MARQKTKLSERFGSGGNKENSPEDKFFSDPDIQVDAEWKVIELLRSQIDDITDVINANDAASGSYATLKREYVTSSGSFSTRVTTNDAKTVLVVGTGSGNAKAGNTTTITSGQASAITANTAKVTNADQSKADINALDITEVGTISSGVWNGTAIATDYIAADAIDADKIADDVINSEHYAAASIDNEHLADNAVNTDEIAASAVETAKINDAAVTMAKLANIATDTFIGRTASSAGVPKALSKTEALAILNVENGATADQSDAEILTAIEDGVDSVHYKDGSIDTEHIADDQVTTDKLADSINTAIAANTSKVGFVTTMPTATADCTCTLTVTKNRGVPNALVFTVIDSSGRSPVTKTATISLS